MPGDVRLSRIVLSRQEDRLLITLAEVIKETSIRSNAYNRPILSWVE
jgi:hypothetical protein